MAASLLRVGGREDPDVGLLRLSRVLGEVVLNQVLQVTRQQDRLPAQRLHAGQVEHLRVETTAVSRCGPFVFEEYSWVYLQTSLEGAD